jgi:hypothetical protein
MVSCVVILALGCRSEAAPAEPSNVDEALPPGPADTLAPDTADAVENTGATGAIENLGEAVVGQPNQALEAQPAADPSQALAVDPAGLANPAEPARDLAAELSAAVGSPADCLRDYRPASATTIRVNISALVRPDGMLIEPSATGAGLSTNDLRCVEQRVGDVTLSPLDGEASERVSTFVNIEYQPPQVEEYDVGAPPPKLKDVVQPLPKKKTIPPSGKPIEGPAPDRIDGPSGVPIEGPKGVPIEGPKPKPIEGY